MSTENLNQEKAQDKLKELIDDIGVAMMVTALGKKPLNAIPMTTKKVDKQGNIWFLSLKTSEHNSNITQFKEVQLLYSDPSDMEYVSVYGLGEITTDRKVLEELYDKTSDNWFENIDDPNLTAIKVTPQQAYYWDTKTNKYITLYKLGLGALTGDKQDIGKKGKLNL